MTNGADTGMFRDTFRDLTGTHASGGLARRRRFPRIPTRPDVRINRADPAEYKFQGKAVGYGWFPVILRLQNGDLLCGYREGAAHVYSPDGRAVVSRSRDNGRTWSAAQVVYDPEDYTSGVAGFGQTGDGRIWLAASNQHYDESVGPANDPRAWLVYQAILCSEDDGATWRAVWQSTPHSNKLERMSLRTPLELSNGQIMWVGAAVDENGEPVRATCIQHEKSDSLEFEVRPHPELGPTADEPTMVETRHPGVLIVMMRQQQHGRYYATARSEDYGETWTPWRMSNAYIGPCPTRPWLRRLPDGTLLLCCGQRWIGRTFVIPSHDDGESWDIAHRQVHLHSPTEYHHMWDSHYTDIAAAEDTRWLAVDYIASPKHTHQKGLYGTYIDTDYFHDVHAGLTLAAQNTPRHPTTRGFWSFDETEGAFAREPVAGNYGEIHNAERVGGRHGQALRFNGQDSHVMVYDDATLWVPKYFTLEAWIRTPDPERDQTLISKAPCYTFGLRGGKLSLEIGAGTMVAEMHEPLPANRWVHIAVSFGMRHMYSRATFYVDGKEDSWVSPAYGHEHNLKRYADAVALTDMQIADGPMFQEGFARKNENTDNLVIGMDNDLQGRPFLGLIDEVALHAGALAADAVAASCRRRFVARGHVVSRPLVRPPNCRWQEFRATATVPAGTSLSFSVLDAANRVLCEGPDPALDLAGIDGDCIVLRADFSTTDPGQSPILHDWRVTTDGTGPVRLQAEPMPRQTAAESCERDDEDSTNRVVL